MQIYKFLKLKANNPKQNLSCINKTPSNFTLMHKLTTYALKQIEHENGGTSKQKKMSMNYVLELLQQLHKLYSKLNN
jgi:hypothetical protein